jgi:hypothetical protein
VRPAGAPAKPAPPAPETLLPKRPPRRPPVRRRVRAALAALLTAACGSIPAVSEPLPAQPAPNQFDSVDQTRLGVQVKIETFTADHARAISQSGFAFVRLGVWTNSLNDPQYLKQVAAAFAAADSAQLPVLVTLRSTTPLIPASTSDDSRDAALVAAAKSFATAVERIEQSYFGQILAIELWNEPDLDKYWPTGNVSETFGPFMREVCSQLGAQPKRLPIYGFGFSRAPSPGTLPDALLQDVTRDQPTCLDAVSYHAYGMTPDQMLAAEGDVRARYGVPAVVTEWGTPSFGTLGGALVQARAIGNFLAGLDSTQTPLASLYEWEDSANGANVRERSYGLVDASGQPKPALAAVQAALQPQPQPPTEAGADTP